MCSSPTGTGASPARSSSGGARRPRRVRRPRRHAPPPRSPASAPRSSSRRMRPSPVSFVSGNKKASRARGRVGSPRPCRARSLGYGRSCCTSRKRYQAESGDARALPRFGPHRAGRALARWRRGRRARRPVRHAARRVLRGDDPAQARSAARSRARSAASSTARRRSRTSPSCGSSPRKASAPTSSTLGELAFARAAGIDGDRARRARQHKSDEALLRGGRCRRDRRPRRAGRGELAAVAAGVRRVLVRVTLGVDADTHEAIRTGHHGSKFGLPPAAGSRRRPRRAGARPRRRSACTSTSARSSPTCRLTRPTIELLAAFAVRCRDELGWTPAVVNVGGGFGVRHVLGEPAVDLGVLARVPSLLPSAHPGTSTACRPHGSRSSRVVRSSVAPESRSTAWRSVKRLDSVTWVAVDGGMSDNPRPQLYGARYTALSATRADEPATETVSVAGIHCESGDVLIDDVALPPTRVGDLLAVPATGAYTLAMSSNYNATPRPAAVLVGDGDGAPHPPTRDASTTCSLWRSPRTRVESRDAVGHGGCRRQGNPNEGGRDGSHAAHGERPARGRGDRTRGRGREDDAREAAQAGRARRPRRRRPRSARHSGSCGDVSGRRRGGRRARRPDVRVSPEAGGLPRTGARGVDTARRALLEQPRVLRRRSGLRARRRADRPGPQPASEPRTGARARPRQPAPGRGERHRDPRLLRRAPVHVRRDDRRPEAGLAETPLGPLGRQLPDVVRQPYAARLRARPPLDPRLDRGVRAGWNRVAAGPAPRRRVQHRVRRGVERAELAQPRLPARLRRPGPVPRVRQVGREVPRARRERPDSRHASPPPSRDRSRPAPSSSP